MTKKQQRRLILILGALAALGPFSIDTYLPGFPAIAKDLGTDISKVSLTLTSYFIGISIGQLIYGPLLDRYGRKRPLMIGLILYMVTSFTIVISNNVDTLIGLRLLQAFGGCVGMVASRAIIRDRFPIQEIARVFSSLILVMGVAPIIAPTIGGYISEMLGWRYIFVMLGIFSLILIFMLNAFLSESKEPDTSVSLKPVSIAKNYWIVFTNKTFLIYGLAGSVAMAGLFIYIGGSPFIFMELLEFSEESFGWIFGLNAAGFISGSQINRVWLKKRNSETVTNITGLFLLIISLWLFAGIAFHFISTFMFCVLLFGFMFFLGFVNPNTTAMALTPFEKNAGVASALIGSIRMVGGAVATAMVGFLHDGTALPMTGLMAASAILVFVLLMYARFGPETLATAAGS